jgi:PAS domain S-box-containing protein
MIIGVALVSGRAPAFAALVASTVMVATQWMPLSGRPWSIGVQQQWALVGFLAAGYLMAWLALKMREYAGRLKTQTELVERQRTELQTMLDLIPVGVAVSHDAEGNRITVSPNFAAMLGLRVTQNASLSGPGHEQIPFRALRDGRELHGTEMPMQIASRTGQEIRDFDMQLVFDDGRTLEMRVSAAPLFDADGNVRGAIGAHVDLTAIRQASRALAAASRQKDEFLATLAHELRNPLAPIRYAAALLRADQSPDALDRARATIERQATHMTRLLDDLLDLSRITRNAITLKRGTVDLRQLTGEAIDAVQPELIKRGHNVAVEMPDEPTWISGDHERLHQIIVNLLANATKYTEPCGNITVIVAQDEHDVTLRVRDDGIGLTTEMIPRIFDLFAQVHERNEVAAPGLGIGLAVVERLVTMHGGEVSAASEGLGKGTEFTVRLPRAPAPVIEAPVDNSRSMQLFSAAPSVLVVDDNRDAADSLAAFLQMNGISVTVAYEGPEATELAEKLRPDVIVLDIGMPHVDGLAVATWIRSKPWGSSVRLIALTGWGQPSDRARTRTAGFDLHLVKPVDPDHLMMHLRAMSAAAEVAVGA